MELRLLYRGPATATDDLVVLTSRLRNGIEAGQSIGNHRAAGCQVAPTPFKELIRAKAFGHRQFDFHRLALIGGLDGCQKRGFTLGTASDLAATTSTTQISVIDFDKAREWFVLIPLQHDLHQFVLQAPGRILFG